MPRTTRRHSRVLARTLAGAVLVGSAIVLAAPAATADPQVPFTQDVYARTHLAKSGMDITVPPGVFTGSIDLATGDQTGTLSLPPATVTISLFGVLPAADALFVMEAAGPIHGHVDLATFTVDTTAAFNVRLARLTPHGTSVNLVGDGCTTASPVTVTMHGVVNPATGGTFASTYTIPTFEHCGALTPAITAFVSGPGNMFVASFAPHGAPPPTAPTTTRPPAPPFATADVHAQVAPPAPTAGATADGRLRVTIPTPTRPPLVTATPAPPPSTRTAPPAPPPNLMGSILKSVLGG
jgi:hypothetical protein